MELNAFWRPKPVNKVNKRRYVVYYKNLLIYMEQGMLLRNVHRVIMFKQAKFLKSYVNFNTNMRKNAKVKKYFEIDFFKLMGNSLYGKIVENVRKCTDIRLLSDEKEYQELVNKPTFEESTHFDDAYDAVMAVHMRQTNIMLNKPSCIGFCVLEISKLIMYKFHYEWIVNKYGNYAQLLFIDTNSSCYCISSSTDIYADMYQDKHLFDFSGLPKDSKY